LYQSITTTKNIQLEDTPQQNGKYKQRLFHQNLQRKQIMDVAIEDSSFYSNNNLMNFGDDIED
jgi:hypothetical protein